MDYFVTKSIPTRKMANVMNEQLMHYRKQTQETMFNMVDSHDTARILTLADGDVDLVKATLTFMFLMHGSPCLYYGTEIGLAGGPDPQCRRCMIWEEDRQDRDMYQFTRELIELRKEYQPVLSYGNLRWELILDEEKVVGVKRVLGDDVLIGYFNQGKEDYTVDYTGDIIFGNLNKDSVLAPNGFIVVLQK